MTEASEAHPELADLLRGCVDVVNAGELSAKLESARLEGRRLRVKLGVDPTTTDLHLGHTVPLRKLRAFQDAGHLAVLIIGDYTAQVGDPSGQNVTRPTLGEEQVHANAATYLEQIGVVLDRSPDKLEIVFNGSWFAPMRFMDVLRLVGKATVAQMLEREDFSKRYREGARIGLHEFIYPLMQGWDSVEVRADVELGGTDQLFNLLVGRDLQRGAGQEAQVVLTSPLLVGLDGVKKMSKSYGNAIPIRTEPVDMYGKLMSIPDTLMSQYFLLLSSVPSDEVDALCDPERTHPRKAKARLAWEVTAAYHDRTAADRGQEAFDRQFKTKKLPEDIRDVQLRPAPGAAGVPILEAMLGAGLASSKSDARRKIEGKGVRLIHAKDDGDYEEQVAGPDIGFDPEQRPILRVGRHFVRFVPGGGGPEQGSSS